MWGSKAGSPRQVARMRKLGANVEQDGLDGARSFQASGTHKGQGKQLCSLGLKRNDVAEKRQTERYLIVYLGPWSDKTAEVQDDIGSSHRPRCKECGRGPPPRSYRFFPERRNTL